LNSEGILYDVELRIYKPIKNRTLLKQKILRGPSQSITKIDHNKYLFIKEEGDIDERFTFN